MDDRAALAVTAGAAAAAWFGAGAVLGRSVAVVLAVAAAATLTRRRRLVVAVAATFVVGAVAGRAEWAWQAHQPGELGPYTGWAEVVIEAGGEASSPRIVVEVGGDRFEIWLRGRAAAARARQWSAGDRVMVAGDRRALPVERQRRVAWQHVVGVFDADWLGDRVGGNRLWIATNRLRDLVRTGAAHLPGDDAALLRGLVIGDDADQPAAMIERFRASGLSHLTAVSGQNVALVVAAASPALRRLRTWWRWAATVALIGWFVVLTRMEPSVLRAGAMASLAATSFAAGRSHRPRRLVMTAVVALLLIDPLLVTSVGFVLSVGATAGLVLWAGPLQRRLRVLGPLATPLAVTLAAQLGVAAPSLLVFGRLSFVGVFVNLAAVPVAGFVMLYGLPAVLVAGLFPAIAAPLLLPAWLGVRVVDRLAAFGAAVEPHGSAAVAAWVGLGAGGLAVAVASRHNGGDDGAAVPRRRRVDPAQHRR